MLETPLVRYDSIKIGSVDLALSSDGRASFAAPYNRIDVKFTPTNCSLSYYEVRITEKEAECDIGVGNLAYWDTNITNNVQKSFSIPVNATLFNAGDTAYRVSLYAKSAVDGSWDVVKLLFTVNGLEFTTTDGLGFGVLTDQAVPESE